MLRSHYLAHSLSPRRIRFELYTQEMCERNAYMGWDGRRSIGRQDTIIIIIKITTRQFSNTSSVSHCNNCEAAD